MTGVPDVRVEISQTGPNGTQTWVDESAYVEGSAGLSMTHGRADEQATASPGRLTLTMDNSSGRFTFGIPNAAGCNRWPGQRVRVSVKDPVSLAWVARFDGTVDGWPTTWGPGAQPLVALAATDRLKTVAGSRGNLGGHWETARRLGASVVLPMTGPSPYAGYDTSINPIGTYGGASGGYGILGPHQSAGDNPDAQESANKVARWSSVGASSTGYAFGWYGAWTDSAQLVPAGMAALSFWVRINDYATLYEGDPSYTEIWFGIDASFGIGAGLKIHPTDGLCFTSFDVAEASWGASMALNDGSAHLIGVRKSGSNLQLWVDGALVATYASGAAYLGSRLLMRHWFRSAAAWLDLAYVTAFATDPGAQGMLDLYRAVVGTGYDGELTSERVARALVDCGIPATEHLLDAGTVTMTAPTPRVDTSTALQAAQVAEGGLLFADGQGRLVFHNRARRVSPTVALSLDADDVGPDLALDVDDTSVRNRLTVNRVAAGATVESVTLNDTTSQGRYGTRSDTVSVEMADGPLFDARCGELFARVSDVQVRARALKLDLLTLPAATGSAALALEIGSVVQVSGLPAGADVSSAAVFVEGWTERLSPVEWSMDLTTSPAWLGTPFLIGTDSIGGAARLGY